MSTDALKAEVLDQPQGATLRKELGLLDLALAQIVYMVSLDFFGTAAKAGSAHVFLWLVAIVCFFIPIALVVAHLNQWMPVEGGLYEWARIGFSDSIGFLVAWNLWLYVVLLVAQIGLISTTFFAFALGQNAAWITTNKPLITAVSIVIIAALAYVSARGLQLGKWVTNVGGILTIAVLAFLVLAPFSHSAGSNHHYSPLRVVIPPLSLFSLSVFSKMTFGALCGFELVAIFAAETRDPARSIRRSVLIAAPIIALLYILGTSAILAFVSSGDVNIIGPIAQALSLALQPAGLSALVAGVTILLLLTNQLATSTLLFSASARLPMVAGWDHLLPAWFTRLHRLYKTPVNSVLFVAAVTLVASVAVLIGVGEQEAFAMLQIWAFTFYGLSYLVMFAIPLFGRKQARPALWLRAAALSGFLVTLLFVLLSVFPIIPVESQAEYTWKTVAVILGANAMGILLHLAGRSKPELSQRAAARD
ncbi:MAG TPA: APC family permease [Terriglobales bacterium]|nr:APC family permease [Terriglobales bacterium]